MGEAEANPTHSQLSFVTIAFPSQYYNCKPWEPMKDPLTMRKALSYPNNHLFSSRITHEEWYHFTDELHKAYYDNFPNCGFLGTLYILLPLYMVYECRIRSGELRTLYEVTAKFNQYLFLPRGIRCHVQLMQAESVCASQVFALKFNIAEPAYASSQLDIWDTHDHYVNHICYFRIPTHLVESKIHDEAMQIRFGADNVAFQAKNAPPILSTASNWKPAKKKRAMNQNTLRTVSPMDTSIAGHTCI